ncbi:MAG: hypothetical protein AAGF31_00810 [Planctomycetota bacterium]
MPEGDPGQEQFARAVTRFRNKFIMAAMAPLFTMRSELIGDDEFKTRGGIDTTTRNHLLQHLIHADKHRRHITYNPDEADLNYIETAIDPKMPITELARPFGGDEVQGAAGGELNLMWALDGSDVNIPLASKLNFRSQQSKILLGALDAAIVDWTRIESRHSTRHITVFDSLRMHSHYQQFLSLLAGFSGDANRVDIASGVLPSEEPRGPLDSPNFRDEQAVSGNNNTYVGASQDGGSGGGSASAQAANSNTNSTQNWLN